MSNINKPEASISQWDALMLESLKAHGWTNEELINRVRTGDLPADDSKFQFDYKGLTAFASENASSFEQAVNQGYQIKYNTIRGIHSWILVALRHEAELLLEPGHEAVVAALSESEAQQLTSALSFGWHLVLLRDAQASGGKASYRIEPIQR